jgi:hypothetical protein
MANRAVRQGFADMNMLQFATRLEVLWTSSAAQQDLSNGTDYAAGITPGGPWKVAISCRLVATSGTGA